MADPKEPPPSFGTEAINRILGEEGASALRNPAVRPQDRVEPAAILPPMNPYWHVKGQGEIRNPEPPRDYLHPVYEALSPTLGFYGSGAMGAQGYYDLKDSNPWGVPELALGAMGAKPGVAGLVGLTGLKNLSTHYWSIPAALKEFQAANKKGAPLKDLWEMSSDRLKGTPIAGLQPDPLTGKAFGEISDLPLREGVMNFMRQADLRHPGIFINEDGNVERAIRFGQQGGHLSNPTSIVTHPELALAYPDAAARTKFTMTMMPSTPERPVIFHGSQMPGKPGTVNSGRSLELSATASDPDLMHRVLAHEFTHFSQTGEKANVSKGGNPIDMVPSVIPDWRQQIKVIPPHYRDPNTLRHLASKLYAELPDIRASADHAYYQLPGEWLATKAFDAAHLSRDELAQIPMTMRPFEHPYAMPPHYLSPHRDLDRLRAHPDLQKKGVRMSVEEQERALDEYMKRLNAGSLPGWKPLRP